MRSRLRFLQLWACPGNGRMSYGRASMLHDQVRPCKGMSAIDYLGIDLAIATYLAVSLPSLGAITCPVRVESCRSSRLSFSSFALTTSTGLPALPPDDGCLTPISCERKEKTNVNARKAETPMSRSTNRRLGPGATGMLDVILLDVQSVSIIALCRSSEQVVVFSSKEKEEMLPLRQRNRGASSSHSSGHNASCHPTHQLEFV